MESPSELPATDETLTKVLPPFEPANSSSNNNAEKDVQEKSPSPPPQEVKLEEIVSKIKENFFKRTFKAVSKTLFSKCTRGKAEAENYIDHYFHLHELRLPNDETRKMLTKYDKQIKSKIEEIGKISVKELIFIGYKTQRVSGTDFFLKTKIVEESGESYYHIRIYQSLQNDLILQDVVGPKLNSEDFTFY